MGFNPNQPRKPDGEFTGFGGGGHHRSTTHTNSPYVTGSFASSKSSGSNSPAGRAGSASAAQHAQKPKVQNAKKAAPKKPVPKKNGGFPTKTDQKDMESIRKRQAAGLSPIEAYNARIRADVERAQRRQAKEAAAQARKAAAAKKAAPGSRHLRSL